MNLENDVREIVSEIVGVSQENLDPDASFMDDLGLDSLRALEILAAVENKFQITINPDRLQEMTTLNNVIAITKQYVA